MKIRLFSCRAVFKRSTATVTAYAFAGGVDPTPGQVEPTGEPDQGNGRVVTSIDDIDPDVCNLMHNRAPCTAEELGELGNGPMHGDPTYDEWLSDFGMISHSSFRLK